MAGKNTPEVKEEQKQQTKYDRKIAARKAQEAKDKQEAKVFKVTSLAIGIVIVLAVLAAIGTSVYHKVSAVSGTYVKIGDRKVSKLEFDYYYNEAVSTYLNTYGSFLMYMGLDTTRDFAEQAYSENMTWKDMFEQMAVEQMTQIYALSDDAKEAGFTYDDSSDYEGYLSGFEEAAKEAGVSAAEYYKQIFGQHATAGNVKPFIKEELLATAYYNDLLEANAPSDEEIQAYYQDHTQNYDKVDYRSFMFTANVAETDSAGDSEADTSGAGTSDEDASKADTSKADTSEAGTSDDDSEADTSDADVEKAMAELKKKADAFMEARKKGSDFEALCIENVSEEGKADYEDEATEYCLKEGQHYSSLPSAINGWLFDESRKEGDIEVIKSDYQQYYVVEFVRRYYDAEESDAAISSTISSEKANEYISSLIEKGYEVTDTKGVLKYLTVDSGAEEETDAEAETDANENTAGE